MLSVYQYLFTKGMVQLIWLRFDCDLNTDSHSIAIWPHYDYLMTYITKGVSQLTIIL